MAGCGILRREIRWLSQKNAWPLDMVFLDSALHVDFDSLERHLCAVLHKYQGRDIVVFYGCCHPLIDGMLEGAHAIRTEGQNCIDMLLGNELFSRELANGAYFLLEEWARRWDYVTTKTFGPNKQVAREIFQGDRKYLLCIRTPCSGDFSAAAVAAGESVGLPLRWIDVSLEHLELVLQAAITRKTAESPCPKTSP